MPTLVEKKPISITYDGSGNPTTFVEFEDTVSNRHVVPVIHGGTGADSASGARTALGLGTLSTANSVAVGNLSSNIDATDINFIAAKAAELETARTIHGVSFDGSTNIDLSEVIQDTVGAMFSSNTETNITATYQDSDGTIDLVSTDTTLTTEEVQDIVGAQIVTNGSHTGISFAYDDANDGAIDATVSLSGFSTSDLSEGTNLYYTDARFDTRLGTKDTDDLTEGSTNLYFTDEKAQDAVGGMLTGNTETLITVTYDDANALINFVVDNDLSNYDNSTSGFITATLTQEEVEDFVGGMVSGNTETLIGVTYDDTNGKLDFVVDNDLSNYSNTSSAFITLTSLSGSTGVTYDNTTGAISIGQDVGTSSDVQFNDVTVSGDLTVNGTTTTVSSTNTEIADKLIELANGATGTPSGDSGIVIERGTADNAFIGFDESVDKFIVGTGTFTGASTGNLTITTGTLVANLEGNVTGTVSSISNFDTDDLSEGSTNLYYTNARFDTQLGTKDTDDLTEGSTNLYYTDARTNSAFDTRLGTKDTDDLTEGSTNLYFTDARAQSAITGSTGINVSSGAVSIDNTVATLTGSQTLTNKTINLESNTVIVEYAVTVSGGNFLIDGEANATISFRPGVVHRFDLSDSSTSSHPFKLSTTSDGSHNSGSEYTTGKTSNGSQGSSGAYVEYTVNAATPDILYYYCSSHSGMGGTITVFGSAYGDADVQSYLSAGTGIALSGSGQISSTITQYADSDVQSYLSAGSGIAISGSGQISSTITQYADSDVQSYLSAGTGIAISGSGQISSTITQYADSDVQSYLSGGNGLTLSGSGAFSVDATVITGQTAETSIADDDLVLIYDTSATALKKMTKANFVAGLSGGGGTVTEAFRTIAVSGQSDVVADSATDSLTFAAGSNVTITTNASTDTVTIASTDTQLTQEQVEDFVNGVIVAGSNITKTYDDAAGTLTIAATGGAANAFSTLAVSGQSDVVADATTDTLTLSAGTGMTITTDASTDTITFASSGGGGNTIPFTEFDGTTDNIVLGGSTTFATLADADGDTEIDLERTSDNDSIIFKAGGTDVMTATSSGVTVATQSSSDNSTKIATTAYVTSALGGISSNSVADADSDTKIQVEESSDEDIIRVDTAGQERLVMDNNVSMAARGGFFTHNLAMHASETFTIAATEGTVAAGPLDVQGTVDVQGSLVVL